MSKYGTVQIQSAKQHFAAQSRLPQLARRPMGLAQDVLDRTFEDSRIEGSVKQCRAYEQFRKGELVIEAGQQFFLVRCTKAAKFGGEWKNRFYVVAEIEGEWQTSAQVEQPLYIAKAQAHKIALERNKRVHLGCCGDTPVIMYATDGEASVQAS